MKRTIEDIRANLDYVGCNNETALEMCGRIERLQLALEDARLQIEYLDAKFQPTGTSANVLARIEAVLRDD